MAQPRSADPKRPLTLSLRESTIKAIAEQLPPSTSVGRALSAAVELKYGTTGNSREDPNEG